MENWTQRVLLTARAKTLSLMDYFAELSLRRLYAGLFAVPLMLGMSGLAVAQDEPLIDPDVKPKEVKESLIDTENFELGVYGGIISIEDFESSLLYGIRLAYHLSEYLFVEGNYGFAEAGKSSVEKFGPDILSDSDREYEYYNVSFGYNILPGEAFFKGWFSGQTYALNTNFYIVAGAGATEFAGDSRFTANAGVGFQVLASDALAFHVIFREHAYDIDVLGEDKTSFNTEFSGGLSLFF